MVIPMRSNAILVTLVLLAACTNPASPEAVGDPRDALDVVVTMYPLEEFVKAVGGEHVAARNLLAPGAEPHGWQLRASDVAALERADLIVRIGAGFETWLDEPLTARTFTAADHVELLAYDDDHGEHSDEKHADHERADHEHGDEMHAHDDDHTDEKHSDETHSDEEHPDERTHEETRELGMAPDHEMHSDEDYGDEMLDDHEDGHDHGPNDPHIWLSFENDQAIVTALAERLAAMDPEHAEAYRANAIAYNEKLAELDAAYRSRLEGCSREFVVNHAAFGYLAHEYELEQIAIFGLTHDDEPTPREIAKLQELIGAHGVRTVFTEELVSATVAESIARDTGLTVRVLNPAPSLTQAQLDKGTSFIDVMYENLEALEAGLC